MLPNTLTPVSSAARFAGRVAALVLSVSLAAPLALGQTSSQPQQPAAPSTSTAAQPSSSGTQAAPGTKPMASHRAAVALAPGRGPRYDNKWEIFGGLTFMNGQAGQNLPKRYNMGGAEGEATYWLTPRLGVAGDYRFGAGTTPVISPYYNRVLIMQHIFAGGVQYRGPKNRYAAIDYHALVGASRGIFDHAVQNYPGGSPVAACRNQAPGQQGNLGLYCNSTSPWAAVGGSIDFNQGAKLALRISPDLTFEHFGTELREFVGVSGGVIYRFGHR